MRQNERGSRTDMGLHEAMGTKQFQPIVDGWGLFGWAVMLVLTASFWMWAWSVLGTLGGAR